MSFLTRAKAIPRAERSDDLLPATGGLARNTAKLVGDFAMIAREPGFVYAESGRRLAHSPELSAAFGLRYDRTLVSGTNVYGSFNWSFTGER